MNRIKHFTAFLILLLLTATFVAVVHHHENTADDHDCPICLVSNHQQATSQSTVAFDGVPVVVEAVFDAPSPANPDQLFISFFNNRAPPA